MSSADHLDDDCIFCKIIRVETPSFKVFEDGKTFAFMEINSIASGHSLVIPKFHSANLYETPDEWVAVTATAIRRLAWAVEKTLEPAGVSIVQANGPGAKQSVHHLHMHVIPRGIDDDLMMSWELVPGDTDAIGELAERIKANLD